MVVVDAVEAVVDGIVVVAAIVVPAALADSDAGGAGAPPGLASGGEPAWLLAHAPSRTTADSSRAAFN